MTIRAALIYGYLALGLLRMAGFTLNRIPAASAFARTTALSPSPAPFQEVRSWAGDPERGIWFECAAPGALARRTQWGPGLRERLALPEPMLSFYSGTLNYLDSRNHPLLAPQVLGRLLCGSSRLAEATGCGPGQEAAVVYRSGSTARSGITKRLNWQCPR